MHFFLDLSKETLGFKEVATLAVFPVTMRNMRRTSQMKRACLSEDGCTSTVPVIRGRPFKSEHWLVWYSIGLAYLIRTTFDHVSVLINTPLRTCNSSFKSTFTP